MIEEGSEFAGGGGIVRAVEVNGGMGLEFFETAGPDGVGDAFGDGFVGDSKAALLEIAGGGEGVEGVLQLEAAGEAGSDFECGAEAISVMRARTTAVLRGFIFDAKEIWDVDDGAVEFVRASEDDFACFGALFGENDGHAGLQDAGFFGGDFREGVAEEIFVVEIDAGDDGNERVKNIGGVEAAAEADFEDAEFDAFAGETFEGHGGDAFEVGGMGAEFAGGEKFFDQGVDARESFREGVVADFFAVDADALVDSFEMRRSVEAGSKAGVAKDGFEEGRGGTFAIRAGDVGAGIGAVGAAESFGENGDVFEIEFCGATLAWARRVLAIPREKAK